ncbi:MAG: YkgJ family cysteine cluster protein, partial [Phycisphaerae bacterium]|nr:YkgJ family cysteine cluster protein [Phycisphaerae bacterium]
MSPDCSMDSGGFVDAVRQAYHDSRLPSEFEPVYREIGRLVARHQPVCRSSGRCCRFDEFGHRLYVTSAEMGLFLRRLQEAHRSAAMADPTPPAGSSRLRLLESGRSSSSAGCPFQSGRLCTVHAIRPFGCRIFFCDESSEAWQSEAYERLHAEIRAIHRRLQIP